jgi:hypothetical protein
MVTSTTRSCKRLGAIRKRPTMGVSFRLGRMTTTQVWRLSEPGSWEVGVRELTGVVGMTRNEGGRRRERRGGETVEWKQIQSWHQKKMSIGRIILGGPSL